MKKSLLITAMLGSALVVWADPSDLQTTSPYQGSKIETGGTYYLYNVESGKWIDANDQIPVQWRPTAALTNAGFDIEVRKPDGFNGYQLYCRFINTGSIRANDADQSFPFGLDGGDDSVTDWNIEPAEGSAIPNAYTISIEAQDGVSSDFYMGAEWNDDHQCFTVARASKGVNTTWQFVSREERIAKMVEEAKNTPSGVDATWLIPNHNMVDNNKRMNEDWHGFMDGDFTSFTQIGGDFRGYAGYEAWQGRIDKYTVIEGLPEGSYEFSLTGFYREGNPWASQKVDGPFDNKGWYYAGTTGALVKNAFDEVVTEAGKPGFNESTAGRYFTGYQAGITFANGYYKNTPVAANVGASGKLVVGIWKDEVIAEDSFNFKQMTLTYKTAKTTEDASKQIETLNNVIKEGEKYSSNSDVATAITEAKTAVNGTASDIVAAIRNLNSLLEDYRKTARFNEMFAIIKKNIPAGTDISNAQAMFDAASNDDEYNNAINTLRTIRRMANLKRIPDMFKGEAKIPTDGKMFYLYNVGQQTFFDGGSEWAGHPMLDAPGAEFIAEDIQEDGLTSALSTNFRASETNHYFSSWGSMDGNAKDLWKFTPVDGQENVFTMMLADQDKYVIFREHNAGGLQWQRCERAINYELPADQFDAADKNGWWKIVTREERDALLLTATLEKPVEASYHIADPGFNRILHAANPTAWSANGANVTMGQWEWNLSETAEASNIVPGEFEIFQEIPAGELPYGVYVIECNGYYRHGTLKAGDANCVADNAPVKPVRMFTNDPETTTDICNILDGANLAPGEGQMLTAKDGTVYEVPSNYVQSAAYYRSGVYKNYLVTNFQKGDEIEDPGFWIGFEYPEDADPEEPAEGHYLNVDDIRITYYGDNTTVDAVKDAIEAGITDVISDAPAAAASDNRIYNLQGIQVANPTAPGIYICNGKKFVVR